MGTFAFQQGALKLSDNNFVPCKMMKLKSVENFE